MEVLVDQARKQDPVGEGVVDDDAAAAFAPAPAKAAPRAAPLNAVGLYYSTTTGNTETVAGYLTAATGIEAVDIDSVDDETLTSMDALICGAP